MPAGFAGRHGAAMVDHLHARSERIGSTAGAGRLAGQGHHDHDRVVDVGIELVGVFEIPSARFAGDRLIPVAAAAHFLRQQPLGRTPRRGMVGFESRGRQGAQRDGRVPYGRFARLHANGLTVVDFQLAQLVETVLHLRRFVGIAQASQCDDAPDHGRKDGSQAFAPFEALDDPGFGGFKSALAQRAPAATLKKLQPTVDGAKEMVPAQQAGASLGTRSAQWRPVLGRPQEQLIDAELLVELHRRAAGPHDR